MNVLVVRVEEVETVDVRWNWRKVRDAVYLRRLSDDREVKQRRKETLMKVRHLHYRDDVLWRRVQRILVYNLNNNDRLRERQMIDVLGSHSSNANAASDALENDI